VQIEQLITVLFISIVAIVIIVCRIGEKRQNKQNDAQPRVSVQARILRINRRNSGKWIWMGKRVRINQNRRYYITFALLPEGNKKRLVVPVSGYEWVSKKDVGMLTLQGTRFIHFKR